jgi:hypothetical protein
MNEQPHQKRTNVFISYSHKDKGWLDLLYAHLKPLNRDIHIGIWDDTKIASGAEWREEIKRVIQESKVAVLLISADFFSSDFITQYELPTLLKAAQNGEILILPVIISPSRFMRYRRLAKFQAANDPSKPLINLTKGQREAIFDKVAQRIEAAHNYSCSKRPSLPHLLPAQLSFDGFAYSKPGWLTAETREHIAGLAREALMLLAFERTATGCWGKTYLYRRKMTNHPLPLVGGALTGTPIALIAIGSYAKQAKAVIYNRLYFPLSQTLARFLQVDEGKYRRPEDTGAQFGSKPDHETEHHAAGGCLVTMLFGRPGPGDEMTLRWLNRSKQDLGVYETSAVARAFLHASYMDSLPGALRRQAANGQRILFRKLVKVGKSAEMPSHIWGAQGYLYQWGTVWWILPCLTSEELPLRVRHDLESLLRHLLLARCAADLTEGKLLPKEVDLFGKGGGRTVFGSAMALLGWRTLESYGPSASVYDKEQAVLQSQRMVHHIIRSSPEILELPASGKPEELEGYLGWAGLCLVAASLGIQASSNDLRATLDLVDELNAITTDSLTREKLQEKYQKVICQRRMYSPETSLLLARVASMISTLYERIADNLTRM